jgi:hypothetical protein
MPQIKKVDQERIKFSYLSIKFNDLITNSNYLQDTNLLTFADDITIPKRKPIR